jgi:hypothetical protein
MRGMAVAVALTFLAPSTALAQDDPGSDAGGGAPPDQTLQIRGRVSSFDGAYSLVVRDEQGYLDNIQLHQGTIINPTGMTLAPGMIVSVVGFNNGSSIGANEIDTPYTVYGGTPFYDGHPWTYFGAGVAIGVFFASPLWWHGAYFGGGYRVVDGRRYWAHVDRERLYRGGYFHGHEFIADVHHGGWAGHGDPRVLGRYAAHGPMEHGPMEHGMPGHGVEHPMAAHPVDIHGRPIMAEHAGTMMAGHGAPEMRAGSFGATHTMPGHAMAAAHPAVASHPAAVAKPAVRAPEKK